MSLDTLRNTADRLLTDGLLGPSLTVVWHAGEPLVLPADYYENAFNLLEETLGRHCALSHSIQTNATLVNDDWCALFKKYRVNIGVSMDGPQHLHDRHRKTRNGKGTYEQTLQGIETLRRNGIPLHVIAVVTADSLSMAKEIHDFFVSKDIGDIGFNFDEAEGVNAQSSLEGQEYLHARFLEQSLDLSRASNGLYRIRELINAFRLISQGLPNFQWRGKAWPENAQTLPFLIITVGWNGDFSTFSPELLGQPSVEFGDFILGNVSSRSFLEATRAPGFQQLWEQILKGTEACRHSCAYFQYCGGGAPVNKLYENGRLDSSETLYCRSMMQRPFETVLKFLERVGTGDASRFLKIHCSEVPTAQDSSQIKTS